MSDLFQGVNTDSDESLDLTAMVTRAFARCSNWPREAAGVQGLAQDLRRAADRYGAAPADIIAECVNSSSFCPTGKDLMEVARALQPEGQREKARPTKCPHGLCDGSGWREVCHLHTRHSEPGRPAWVEKTTITREQYEILSRKVFLSENAHMNQAVYESRYRCQCHPEREPAAETPRKRKAG